MAIDTYYDSVTLLLHCNGSNTSTSFGDNSKAPKAITPANQAQISTAQSKFGGSSALFDGTGDYLDTGFVAMGSSDFTLEGWFYFNALGAGNRTLFSQYTGADAARTIFDIRNAKLSIFSGSNGTQSGTTTLITGQWYHIAFVRVGTTCKGYLDGVLEVTHNTFQTPYATSLRIGSYPTASGDEYSGYMDDIRFTNGVARYVANFSVPTEEFADYDSYYSNILTLLHCNGVDASTTFTDSGPSPKTVTPSNQAQIDTAQSQWGGASALFDGSGDYLDISGISGGLGSGNLTIEMWVRTTTIAAGYATLYHLGAGFPALYRNGSTFVWYDAGAGGDKCTSASISANTWYHLAMVRNGTTFSMYVNGVASGTTYTSSTDYTGTTHRVGCNTSGAEPFSGWLDDIRITKGVARYTSAFTPPPKEFQNSAPPSEATPIIICPRNNRDIYQIVPVFHLYL